MKLHYSVFYLIALFAIVMVWQVFRYHECKKVGHSTFYCVVTIN